MLGYVGGKGTKQHAVRTKCSLFLPSVLLHTNVEGRGPGRAKEWRHAKLVEFMGAACHSRCRFPTAA